MRKVLKVLIWSALALVALVLALLPWIGPLAISWYVEDLARDCGIPVRVRSKVRYCWTPSGPGVRASGVVTLPGTRWRAEFDARGACSFYEARVKVPEVSFSEREALADELLHRYPQGSVSNLTFSGKVALEASVRRCWSFPVPEWHVRLPVRDFTAYGERDDTPVSVEGLSFALEMQGIADRIRVTPTRVRAAGLTFGGHELTNFYASVWSSGKRILVSQAGANYCGGTLVLQSAFFDVDDLDSGCTVYVENADAQQLLRSCAGFKGRATGRLNGRLPFLIRKGKRIRLQPGYLYSQPGEHGKFSLDDPAEFSERLAMAGLDDDTRENVANALADMDYDVLRLSFDSENEGLSLRILLSGSATRGRKTVPVSFDLTLHGDLELLINAGLKLSGRKEQIR